MSSRTRASSRSRKAIGPTESEGTDSGEVMVITRLARRRGAYARQPAYDSDPTHGFLAQSLSQQTLEVEPTGRSFTTVEADLKGKLEFAMNATPETPATHLPAPAALRSPKPVLLARDPETGARLVYLSAKIMSLQSVNNVDQCFGVDLILIARWIEPQLIGAEPAQVEWDSVWQPRLNIKNALEVNVLEDTRGRRLQNPSIGLVMETRRVRSTISAHLSLERFPLDSQNLTVIVSVPTAASECRLVDESVKMESCQLHEWEIHKPTFKVCVTDPNASTSGRSYPELHIIMPVTRRYQYYLWSIAFVACMITTLGLLPFALPASDIGGRLSISLTLLLTAVTFTFVVADSLPKVAYLTLLDKYVIFNFMCLYFVAVENGVVGNLADEIRDVIDQYAMYVVSASWVLMHLFMLTTFRLRSAQTIALRQHPGGRLPESLGYRPLETP